MGMGSAGGWFHGGIRSTRGQFHGGWDHKDKGSVPRGIGSTEASSMPIHGDRICKQVLVPWRIDYSKV